MLSPLDILLGGFAAGIVILSIVIGVFFIYKSRKLNLYLLSIAAFMIIFASLFYISYAIDFFFVLFTETNMANPYGIHGILTCIWVAPTILCALIIGTKLLSPNKQISILIPYLLLGIAFEVLLLLDPYGTVEFFPPPNPGEGLIDNSINPASPGFILVVIFLLSALLFNGIGFLYKSTQVGDPIKKNYRLLAIGFILFCVCSVFDGLMAPGYILIVPRIGMLIAPLFIYYGLKTK